MAVDRDRVADPAVVGHVVAVAEIVADGGGLRKPPVVEYPGHVAVDPDRLCLLDDERTVKPAPDLLEAALVRVVPKCAGIDGIEFIGEGLAGTNRSLRQVRHAVHGVRQSHAVPVDGGRFFEAILDDDPQAPAVPAPALARNARRESVDFRNRNIE